MFHVSILNLRKLKADLLWLVGLPKRAVRFICWWLIWNTKLGKLAPWITAIAIWRWPRAKSGIYPDPFASKDTDCVVVSGTERRNGMWVQCHKCRGGFPAFSTYMKYLLLVKEELPKTPSKEAMSRIEVACPNCRKINSYWFYDQAIKDLYGGPDFDDDWNKE